MRAKRVDFIHVFAIAGAALTTAMLLAPPSRLTRKAASRGIRLAESVTIGNKLGSAAAAREIGGVSLSHRGPGVARYGQKLRCARKTAENTPVSAATNVVGAV